MAMFTVTCSDGTQVDVDREMGIVMSGTFAKHLDRKSAEDANPLVLDNVTFNTLMKVLEFCSVHTTPSISGPNLKAWDEKFVRLEPGELCELASAAYYLEIRPLVELTCRAIAKLLRGKSPSEIRKTFNILYDFGPGDDAPPPTIRDKLRNRLYGQSKDKDKGYYDMKETADNRSVEDLLSFIDGKESNPSQGTKANKTKKKKRNRLKKSSEQDNENTDSDASSSTSSPSISEKKTKENGVKMNCLINNVQAILDSSSENVSQNLSSLNVSDDIWGSDEEEEPIDPELKAAQDKEVEEFRMRLEGIKRSGERPKVNIPIDTLINNLQVNR